jgi:hypothetical protein
MSMIVVMSFLMSVIMFVRMSIVGMAITMPIIGMPRIRPRMRCATVTTVTGLRMGYTTVTAGAMLCKAYIRSSKNKGQNYR